MANSKAGRNMSESTAKRHLEHKLSSQVGTPVTSVSPEFQCDLVSIIRNISHIVQECAKTGNSRKFNKNLDYLLQKPEAVEYFFDTRPYLFWDSMLVQVNTARPEFLDSLLHEWQCHANSNIETQLDDTEILRIYELYEAVFTNYSSGTFELLQTFFPESLKVALQEPKIYLRWIKAAIVEDQLEAVHKFLQLTIQYTPEPLQEKLYANIFDIIAKQRVNSIFYDEKLSTIQLIAHTYSNQFKDTFADWVTSKFLKLASAQIVPALQKFEEQLLHCFQDGTLTASAFLNAYEPYYTTSTCFFDFYAYALNVLHLPEEHVTEALATDLDKYLSSQVHEVRAHDDYDLFFEDLAKFVPLFSDEVKTTLLLRIGASMFVDIHAIDRPDEVSAFVNKSLALLDLEHVEPKILTNTVTRKNIARQLVALSRELETTFQDLSSGKKKRVGDIKLFKPVVQLLSRLEDPTLRTSYYLTLQRAITELRAEKDSQVISRTLEKLIAAQPFPETFLTALQNPMVWEASEFMQQFTELNLKQLISTQEAHVTAAKLKL